MEVLAANTNPMPIQHNYLRTYRKRAPLSLSDLAAVLGLAERSNIARWEGGTRTPAIETLLAFHLIYGVPVESFFRRQRDEMALTVKDAIASRIAELRAFPSVPKLARRIAYLESAFTRLNEDHS